MVGAVVMTHADDNGLRVPPRGRPVARSCRSARRSRPGFEAATSLSERCRAELVRGPVRAHLDTRDRAGGEALGVDPQGGAGRIELGGGDREQAVISGDPPDDPELAPEPSPHDRRVPRRSLGYSRRYRPAISRKRADAYASAPGTTSPPPIRFREFFSSEETESGGLCAPSLERGPCDRGDDGRARGDRALHPLRRRAPPTLAAITGGAARVMAIFAKAYWAWSLWWFSRDRDGSPARRTAMESSSRHN